MEITLLHRASRLSMGPPAYYPEAKSFEEWRVRLESQAQKKGEVLLRLFSTLLITLGHILTQKHIQYSFLPSFLAEKVP